MTRNSMSMARLGAAPHSSELTVNITMHSTKNRLRPNKPASHPLMGRTMAFDTRYEVSTHVLSSLLAPRSPAMCGSATLAMLVSSTSMNAASATTTAISHGLYFGVQTSVGSATILLDVHFGIDREARTQAMIAILAGIEIDAYGHALHHLY